MSSTYFVNDYSITLFYELMYLKKYWIQRNLQEFYHFQPVDLLPFRIEDARRQLESDGDFSFEGLKVLRDAEDERRGENVMSITTSLSLLIMRFL